MKNFIKRFVSLLLSFLLVFSAQMPIVYAQDSDPVDHTSLGRWGGSGVAEPTSADSLSDAIIDVSGSYTYTGEAIVPDITVTLDDVTLTENEDYSVSCRDNVNAGTATVVVTGLGAYSGVKEANFTINKAQQEPPPIPALFCKATDSFSIDMYYGMEYMISGWGNVWIDHLGAFDAPMGGYHSVVARYKETDNFEASAPSEPLEFQIESNPAPPNPQQIPQPRAIWFDGFMLNWDMVKPPGAPEDWDCRYQIELYRDGEPVGHYARDIRDQHKFDLITDGIDQSGSYMFVIMAFDLYDEYEPSEPIFCYYEYIKPDASIAPATNLQWSIENGDVYTSFEDSGNDGIELGFFPYLFQVYDAEYDAWIYGVHCFGTKNRCTANLNASKDYVFKVRIFSGDIRRWTHSPWSQASALLNLSGDIQDVGAALRDLASGLSGRGITPSEALDAIKALDQDELKLAMQSDSELLEIVGEIEAEYLQEKGITATTSVSAWISDKLDGPVSVVGAGLNSSGGNVTLNFENKQENVAIESRYVNYVQMSIEMDGVADSSDLEVPIRITMPIPQPLSVSRLVIMHYTNANTYESVNFTVNGDGTISFTITHLSEFVFAEEPMPDTSWYDGNESASSYNIDTADELAGLAQLVNGGTDFSGKTVNLTANIDLSDYGVHYNGGEGWISIGEIMFNTFKGHFDGGGHVISGLYIDSSKDYSGLFGQLDGTVSNLGLEDVDITGSGNAGGIATNVMGAVERCYVTGAISGAKDVGGISGGLVVTGRISNCYTTCTVSGNQIDDYGLAGGVVGLATGTLEYCYATGEVTGDMYAGGVMGASLSSSAYPSTNCVALNASVTGPSSYTGRVAGDIPNAGFCNYAFSEIPGTWTDKLKNKKNGADVTLEETLTAAFWTAAENWDTSGWDTDIWDIQDDKLPILKGFAGEQPGLPVHLTVLSMNDADITISGTYTYIGGLITPPAENVTVTLDGNMLVNGTDYTYAVTDGGTSAGTATVTVTGAGSYTGSKTATFTIGKALRSAPSQPTLDSKTATSITLYREDAQLEFRIGLDGTWQTNGFFDNLTPNTAYIFYAQYMETEDYFASPVSDPFTVVTDKATLGGIVTITGIPQYAQLLTADVSGLTPVGELGELSYQWNSNDVAISGAAENTFRPYAAHMNCEISVTVTAANCTGSITSASVGPIAKVAQNAPAAPVMTNRTATSITLINATGIEYRRSDQPNEWQDSATFSGLSPNTGYIFYARAKETSVHEASAESPASATITTLKLLQAAPDAPTQSSRTAVQVVLTAPSASGTLEYAKSITTTAPSDASQWQSALTFDTLDPNTTYYFFARLVETATHEASPASPVLTVTTDKAALSGGVTISGTAKYGETLTAQTGSLTTDPVGIDKGARSYQWKRSGANIPGATGSSYTLTQADIGATITVTVTAANCMGEVTSGATSAVTKADGPAAPAVTGSYTGDGTNFIYTVTPITGAEYQMDNAGWQDSNIFPGIAPLSSHTFHARIKETTTHEAGVAGGTGSITFNRLNNPDAPPLSYTVSGPNDNRTITITQVTGAQYKFDGDAWSTVNSKGGYTISDTVSIQVRYAENATHNASQISSISVDLSKQDQAAPAGFILTYSYNSGTNNFTVTIPAVANGEYSFDGSVYDSARTITANPGDSVTGYARYKETITHNASPAAVSSLTLPYPVTSITVAGTGGADTITTNGGALQMLAEVLPAQATQMVTWSISSGSGARVSNSGLLTATANGTVVVRATVQDGAGVYGERSITITGQTSGNTVNSSGDSSSSTPNTATWTTTVTSNTDMPVTATVTIPGTVDANGNITATVTEAMVRDAITKAQTEATRLGKTAGGIIIEIKITATGGKSLTVKVDQAALGRLNTAGAGLSIASEIFRFSLDDKAVKQINSQASGGVTFNVVPTDKLSAAAQTAIGSRPVYDFTLTDNTGKAITSYGTGTITRGIAYKPISFEQTGNLFVVKVLDNGNLQWITESGYTDGWLLWSGSSNSVYGAGYKTPAPAFTDTTSHWAKDNIGFVVSRGLFSGTGATSFSPDTAITRGMFVTALGRLSGQDVSGYTPSSFTDVAVGSYYLPYIEWAVANKIVSGIGNGQFAPDKTISREEMAVMIYNYANATKYTLLASREAVTFTDNAQISSWAKDAVKALQQAGIVSGIGGGNFNPKGTATRAEATTILRNFVEIVIDEAAARGWTRNEASRWTYWTWDGKLRTGWIDTTSGYRYYMDENGIMVAGKWVRIGGKWYYFYGDGKLAINTTIEGYTIGADGAREE